MKWRRVTRWTLLLALLAFSAADAADALEQRAVEALEQSYAMVLAEQGFEAYSALFHPDYNQWAEGGTVRDRTAFLASVRTWYEAGTHAVAVTMRPISTDILGDYALARYELREDFNSGESFVGRFTSVARRHQGRWLAYRTSFQTLYYGATESAPTIGADTGTEVQ